MRLFKLALTIALAMFIIDGAVAQAQTTYYSNGDVSWRDNNAWQTGSCSGTAAGAAYPVAGDTAYICAGDTVSLGANDEAVKILNVAGTLNTSSNTLTISQTGCDLNVTGTGVLNIDDLGTVLITGGGTGHSIDENARIYLLYDDSVLRITTNSATIGGSGAIYGYDGAAGVEIGNSVALTSSTNIQGHLEIRDVDQESGSFVNQGKVYANRASGSLTISVTSVTDTDNGGTVSDTNFRWGVNETSAKLLFKVDATALVGDFFVREGSLEVGEDPEGSSDDIDVCSAAGNILFDGGSIVTGDDDSFKCSGSCP